MGLGIAIAADGVFDEDLASASWVEVHERAGRPATFRARYDIDIDAGDLPMLVDGRLDPGATWRVMAPVEVAQMCLIQGPVHGQQIHVQHGGAGSWVEVTGSDSSVQMDHENKVVNWANVTDGEAVMAIVGGYGYIPMVDLTTARHIELQHTLVQRDTDLRFVQRLARRSGRLFWVSADPLGIETAHFTRPAVDFPPAATLEINAASPSLRSFDITWDLEQATGTDLAGLDPNKGDLTAQVDRSPITALGSSAFADIADEPRTTHLAPPSDDAGDLQSRAEGALIEASWFLTAGCSASFEALGAIVRACDVVEVTGLGSRHSGKYFVTAVRHRIDALAHRMELELARNGWEG